LTNPKITPVRNGPLKVTGLPKLTVPKGLPVGPRSIMLLCRCGASKNKPFCDGTHSAIDFDSRKLTDGSLDFRESYSCDKITIHDNRGICAHAGFCTDGLPEVWKQGPEGWIHPDAASPEEIIAVIERCPSGALSYSIDGVEHRDLEREPEIVVVPDGPYWVRGGIELVGEQFGEGASREHYALCRCGASDNKPFCDGAHRDIGFKG
jgi:CDGSH-type Zn-finger protein